MLTMMQGDSYSIRITILGENDTPITDADVEKVSITFGKTTKAYPDGAVTYDEGEWSYPVTQAQTIGMSNVEELSVRVKYNGGDVEGAKIGNVYILKSDDKGEL